MEVGLNKINENMCNIGADNDSSVIHDQKFRKIQ